MKNLTLEEAKEIMETENLFYAGTDKFNYYDGGKFANKGKAQ